MRTIDICQVVTDEINKSGMSICRISKKSGVGVKTICNWVNGVTVPTIENAQCVLAVLGKELRVEDRSDNAKVSQ